MNVDLGDLRLASTAAGLNQEQTAALWRELEKIDGGRQKFDLAHLAYYFGALIIIGAMSFFMTLGWETLHGGGILFVSLCYAFVFAAVGWKLWAQQGLKVPGGLLITAAVSMTPLAVYGLQRFTGVWPADAPDSYQDFHIWVSGSWIVMELATVTAGLIALRVVRFPFLTAPIAFALWYLSMDLTPLLFGRGEFSWQERQWVSVGVGLLMLAGSYVVDRRTKQDFAFWGYLFGMIAFWGALSSMDAGSQLGRFLYCLVNVVLMFLSVLLGRRVFLVFGALGVFGYLGYLSYSVFADSLLFPVALSGLGLLIIALGVRYQRSRENIERFILGILPARLLWLLPTQRA